MTPKKIITIEPIELRTILSCGLLGAFLVGSFDLVAAFGVLGGISAG